MRSGAAHLFWSVGLICCAQQLHGKGSGGSTGRSTGVRVTYGGGRAISRGVTRTYFMFGAGGIRHSCSSCSRTHSDRNAVPSTMVADVVFAEFDVYFPPSPVATEVTQLDLQQAEVAVEESVVAVVSKAVPSISPNDVAVNDLWHVGNNTWMYEVVVMCGPTTDSLGTAVLQSLQLCRECSNNGVNNTPGRPGVGNGIVSTCSEAELAVVAGTRVFNCCTPGVANHVASFCSPLGLATALSPRITDCGNITLAQFELGSQTEEFGTPAGIGLLRSLLMLLGVTLLGILMIAACRGRQARHRSTAANFTKRTEETVPSEAVGDQHENDVPNKSTGRPIVGQKAVPLSRVIRQQWKSNSKPAAGNQLAAKHKVMGMHRNSPVIIAARTDYGKRVSP